MRPPPGLNQIDLDPRWAYYYTFLAVPQSSKMRSPRQGWHSRTCPLYMQSAARHGVAAYRQMAVLLHPR